MEIEKLHETLTFSNSTSILWDQLYQICVGVGGLIYNYPYHKYESLTPPSWITSQWKFLSETGLEIRGWQHNFTLQRGANEFIMECFVRNGICPKDLQKLNECRIFLQLITLADIVTGDGKRIALNFYNGYRDRFRVS